MAAETNICSKLEGTHLEKLFNDIELPLIPVLSAMELEGIRIDIDALNDFSKELESRILELNKGVQTIAGIPFNLASLNSWDKFF